MSHVWSPSQDSTAPDIAKCYVKVFIEVKTVVILNDLIEMNFISRLLDNKFITGTTCIMELELKLLIMAGVQAIIQNNPELLKIN